MSTITCVGNTLQIRISGQGDQWNRDLNLVKGLPIREYDSTSRIWIAPVSPELVNKLVSSGFTNMSQSTQLPMVSMTFDSQLSTFFKGIKVVDSQLFECQNKHAQQIIYSLAKNGAALDASDTGTGKTYTALAVAKYLKLFPIVITPKSVIPSWKGVAKFFGINCFVSNYEQYKNSNTPYLTIEEKGTKLNFNWNLPKNSILIFDEAHRAKNHTTINSKLLRSAKTTGTDIICLSATIANNPIQMYALGIVLGLFTDWPGFWRWAKNHGVYKGYWGMEFNASETNLKKIHGDLFPVKGSRLKTTEFGDLFPENRILADPYNMGNAGKIQELYNKMDWELSKLKDKSENDKASILTRILRERQEIELLKVPTFVELAEDLIEEGNSVAIFVNFRETIDALSYRLKSKCIIDGRVKDDDREENRKDFQNDKQRVILCNTAAGGVGISLHDITGKYPRVSLISPTYSAQDLLQVLGRLPRAGAKSKVLQKLIYCAGTREEEIATKVSQKIANMKMINDGELTDGDLI